MKQTEELPEFDFGFSFVDEDLNEVKQTNTKLSKENESNTEKMKDLENRLRLLHETIIPFLDNLCKNPEKSTIHWPNRVEKIESYKKKLQKIVEGK